MRPNESVPLKPTDMDLLFGTSIENVKSKERSKTVVGQVYEIPPITIVS
jgi:hypothetical protein